MMKSDNDKGMKELDAAKTMTEHQKKCVMAWKETDM
jgi:hypothetical protein